MKPRKDVDLWLIFSSLITRHPSLGAERAVLFAMPHLHVNLLLRE